MMADGCPPAATRGEVPRASCRRPGEMSQSRPLTLLFALLAALALAAPAQAATPTKRQCKAAKAKKHKTKHDRKVIKKCAVEAKKASAKKKKPVAEAAKPAPVATPAPVIAAPVNVIAPVAPVATPTPTPTVDVPALPIGTGRAVQVRGFEFGLNLSRASVVAGQVRVEFNLTSAEDPHTLVLERTDGTGPTFRFDSQGSGTVTAQSLNLSAGTWHLYCDLPGHAAWGMKVDLEVR